MSIINFAIKLIIYLTLLLKPHDFVLANNENINFTQFGDYITDDAYQQITNFKQLAINDNPVFSDESYITSGMLQFNPATMQSTKDITINNNDDNIVAHSQRLDYPFGSKNVFGYISDVHENTKNKRTYYSTKNNSSLYIGLVPYKLTTNKNYNFGIFGYKATANKPAMVIDASIKNTVFEQKGRIQSIFICGDLDGTAEDTLNQTALLITNTNTANQKKLMLTAGIVIAKTARLISGAKRQNCGLKILSATNNTPVMTGNIINYGYIAGATAISIGSADSCFPIEPLIGTTSRIINYGEIKSTADNFALAIAGTNNNKYNELEILQLTNCGTISGKLATKDTSVKLTIVNNNHITIPADNQAINSTNYTSATASTLKIIFNENNLKNSKSIINSEDISLHKGAKIILSGKNITINEPVEINIMTAQDIELPTGNLDTVLYSEKFTVNNKHYILMAEPSKSYKYNKKVIKLRLSMINVNATFPELILIKNYLNLTKN